MRLTTIKLLARSEFASIVRNPIVIVTTIVLCFLIVLNSAGCSYLLPQLKLLGYTDVFTRGWSNTYVYTLLILTFLSLCIGVVSLSGERSNSSLRLLLTKPLYRTDLIVGKLVGINAFLLLINLFAGVINISSLMVSYGGPESISSIYKIIIFVLVMFIFSSLTTGIMVFCSIILKGVLESLVFAMTYLYATWYVYVPDSLDVLRWINPVMQCKMTVNPGTTIPDWINGSLPVVILMIIEVLAVSLLDCVLFNREDF